MARVTFEQARELVREAHEADWENDDVPGTYMVAPYGKEDTEVFLVIEGAQEYLEGDDLEFCLMDAPAVFVDKATGTVFIADFLEVQDRIQAMDRVGEWPEEPED